MGVKFDKKCEKAVESHEPGDFFLMAGRFDAPFLIELQKPCLDSMFYKR